MRYYVVFFDSSVEEDFKRRVQVLEKTADLPTEVVFYIDDITNGQLVGMYITEQTANRFPLRRRLTTHCTRARDRILLS